MSCFAECFGKSSTETSGQKPQEKQKAVSKNTKDEERVSPETERLLTTLRSVSLLSSLKRPELIQLADALTDKIFESGENLMTQGDKGDEFFIIRDGVCEVIVAENGKETVVATLEQNDYCGEQALLKEATRNATIRAKFQTSTLVLDRSKFQKLFKGVRFAKRDAKRRAIDTENLDNFKIDEGKNTAKTSSEIAWLLDCVQNNILFENLSSEQRSVLVKHMYKETKKQNDILIKQGDEGDTFYVVEEGTFQVYVEGIGLVETCHKGSCTGELALIYNAPRAATVKALTDGSVWVIDRGTFRKALMDHNKSETRKNVGFLKKVELLQPLLSSEITLLDQALQEKAFKAGETIFQKGDKGDKFYLIKSGQVKGENDAETFDLKEGDFFGERALLKNEPRAATIKAQSDVVLLWLSRTDFMVLLGPLEDILSRQADEYEKAPEERDLIGAAKVDDESFCELERFTIIGVLGKGAFGTVKLVVDPDSGKSYALKAIRKLQIMELGQQSHIINEKKVMQMLDSKFLVNLRTTYTDKYRVYFLLDVCLGGELFTVLRKMRSFDEPTARFYTGCVVEAFAYMHSLDVIYRDLKPENLVLNHDGYLKVTDFGFAKVVVNKTFTLCGTPDYLAPEIVTGQGHGKGVDWWTLGVLIYEMIASFPPFFDDEPMMTYRKIISCKFKFPKYLSPESKDIINRLLKPRPTKRLGVIKGGARLLREHPWFNGFNWDALNDGSMDVPIKPTVKAHDDIGNFDQFDEPEEAFHFNTDKFDTSWDKEF